jgi:inorganic pyrophosphatase
MPDSHPPLLDLQALRPRVREHLRWKEWDTCISKNGITIERPRTTAHPDYPSVVYPLDYGSINGTLGTDGEPLDVFVGRGTTGLVGVILTTDLRQQDREMKLLYDCMPTEVYTAHGFINYDRTLLEGVLVLRQSLTALWDETE